MNLRDELLELASQLVYDDEYRIKVRNFLEKIEDNEKYKIMWEEFENGKYGNYYIAHDVREPFEQGKYISELMETLKQKYFPKE